MLKRTFGCTFFTDVDMRGSSVLRELLSLHTHHGEPFTPHRYIIGAGGARRFTGDESLDRIVRRKRSCQLLREEPFNVVLSVWLRPYDGVNQHGRPADPNSVGLDLDRNLFRDVELRERAMSMTKNIYALISPFFGSIDDETDFAEFEKWHPQVLESDSRTEIVRVFWANFLGPALVDRYGGTDYLLESPCWYREALGDGGVLLILSPEPASKPTKEAAHTRSAVSRHLAAGVISTR